jgi:nitrate reductase gamma subunit
MIENVNDFLSLAFLVVVIMYGFYLTYSVFVKHHAHKMQQLESDYYQLDVDDSQSDFY